MKKIGVVVGRFQVDSLSIAHRELIETAVTENDDVIVGIGVSVTKIERTNPLSYNIRKFMIQEIFPNVIIIPINDIGHLGYWNKKLDSILESYAKDATITIYGSRDSMIDGYDGKYNTKEIISIIDVSGTRIREIASKNIVNTQDFRKGIIYAAYDRYPVGYSVVDIICTNGDKILLGKKPNRDHYCLIGGFYDPQIDNSLEDSAIREFKEETGLIVKQPKYFMSAQINDYRYKNEVNKIISSVFLVDYDGGVSCADDDIEDLKWFNIREYINNHNLSTFYDLIIPQHKEIIKTFIETNFIPTLKNLYDAPTPESINIEENQEKSRLLYETKLETEVTKMLKDINTKIQDGNFTSFENNIGRKMEEYSIEAVNIVKDKFISNGWSDVIWTPGFDYLANLILTK
jgi:bifunctional NMN adenylyltransferase/nudix hydrolase